MERQHSRRRKLHQAEEPSFRQPVTPSRVARPGRSWFLVGAFIVCLWVMVVYVFGIGFNLRWSNLVTPPQTHAAQDQSETNRPRIELHPEDHVYRAPVTRHLDWRISKGHRRPDGVLKLVYLINDLFPGPTIEARSGDTLLITVLNAVEDEPVALHWHGIHIANAMDGAVGISQCAIAPGAQFVYNVTIPSDQSGTFWYHAHAGVSRGDGLYGGLIVHAPATTSSVRGLVAGTQSEMQRFQYARELLLMIGDWYHRPAQEVLAWYRSPGNFGNEPVPDSLLINGVGHFDCGMAVPARPLDCISQVVNTSFLDLDPDTTYRIRVVNTGALAGLSLVFEQENIDLVQVDSIDAEQPQLENANSVGVLFPGQRLDLIIHPRPDRGSSSAVTVKLDQGCFKYINPALTPEQTFPIHYRSNAASSETQFSTPAVRGTINLDKVPSAPSVLQRLPARAQQTQVVYTKIQKMARNHNIPEGYFNQTTWQPQSEPPVPLIGLPRERWDSNQFAFSTGSDTVWVDLVVNNLDEGPHPFHMHGHHFFILTVQASSFGWGSYNPFASAYPPGLEPESQPTPESSPNTTSIHPDHSDAELPQSSKPYDLSRASLRDTVLIPSRGYAVLRFRADNPGIWLFHCHILWHLATGMAMLIDVMGDPAGRIAHDLSLLSGLNGGVCPV